MGANHRHTRGLWLGGTALAGALALMASPASAQQQQRFELDVPAQPLDAALRAFASQSRQQLIFADADTKGFNAPALNGAYSADEALNALLSGTSLNVRRTSSGVFLIAAAPDPQSSGAAGDGADGTVEALIVTAQKREEDIQDVPIAISAFTQEALERSQVAGGPDLMTQVPNMTFTKTNFTGYSIQIRGIGTQAISATTDAAVAVAFNNTPFIRNRFFEQEFYDLQRVEVLRGPQGTLYGRNATAGVVNLISQKPKFAYEAKLSADIANYSSTRLEGMINVPLVEDKVALRVAGAWTKRDGFVQNEISGNPIDGRDLWSTRVSMRFSPTETFDANLIWEHFQEEDDRLRSGKQLCHQDDRTEVAGLAVNWAPGMSYSNNMSQGCLAASLYSPDSFEAPNGYSLPYYRPLTDLGVPTVLGFNPYASQVQSRDLRVIESTVDPKYKANSDLVELQWSYDLADNLTLASETSYLYDTIFSLEDYNRFNTASGAFGDSYAVNSRGPFAHLNERGFYEFCDPQIGCADRVVAVDASRAKSSQFSQEFRLSSDYEGPFNFSLGANYLRYDTEDKYYVFINTLTMVAVAGSQGVDNGSMPDWVGGVSDNRECMVRGMEQPDGDKYYQLRGCIYIDPNPIENVNDLGHNYFLSRNPYKLISYALFGETYWQLSDTLKLTAGLRITRDEKQAPSIPSWLLAVRTVGSSVHRVEKLEWTEPTGRLTVDWKPDFSFTDETLLYASYSHGYKAGGANPPPTGIVTWGLIGSEQPEAAVKVQQSVLKPKTFDPEFVDAFELGAKNTFADGRVTLNLAAFYYDYSGYQISQIIDRSAVNYNFDAKIWGLELEADWRALENLRFGLKAGYENTEIADGEQAIDIMDRTGGKEGWVVYRPFPAFPSNCVLPAYVVDPGATGSATLFPNGGYVGACEFAYAYFQDPVTRVDYGNNQPPPPPSDPNATYPGYNPAYDVGQNNGEGFYKPLGGNELPNAPHFTTTLTADYTVPLPHDWLATLHTDLYYQSEAWTRVFNTPGYDKLKAYTNVNIAAIFTNEDAGWKVMAYVKNVFDRDSITGAFLNSDDTGLTTNVFLTEPRLYGIRVTKDFDGGPWWTGATGTGPFPLWVEVGGAVVRQEAPYATLAPDVFYTFPADLDPKAAQHRDLDWGDEREIRLTYRMPQQGVTLRAEVRKGDADTGTTRIHYGRPAGPPKCGWAPVIPFLYEWCSPTSPYYSTSFFRQGWMWSDSTSHQKEEHLLVDFSVGLDVGLGALADSRSVVSAGVRYGGFTSLSSALLDGTQSKYLPKGWSFYGVGEQYQLTFDQYRATIEAEREFKGAGPTLSWDAAKHLLGDEDHGFVDLDWSVTGGVLFGRQTTTIEEQQGYERFQGPYNPTSGIPLHMVFLEPTTTVRTDKTSVPFVDLTAGLSYQIQRVKIGAGYRWERYFDVLDAGYRELEDYDRTRDGPYFKLAIGFGG